MKPALELPVTPWVEVQLARPLPKATAAHAANSTWRGRRAFIHASLQKNGVDIVDWQEFPRRWEVEVGRQLGECLKAT